MSSVLERVFGIVEVLVQHPEGLSIKEIAERLDQAPSGTHRILNEMAKFGYVRQLRNQGEYALTIKLSAMGLGYLSRCGITDVAQPILDQLAQETGELVRLSVVDGKQLTWVGVSQGATGGLRYDPAREQGVVAHLSASASGLAYLSSLSEEDALMLVAEQGLKPDDLELGSGAPTKVSDLIEQLKETRERGYSVSRNGYLEGMTAMAVAVSSPEDGGVIGCVSVAGPQVRMPQDRIEEIAGPLQQAAKEIGDASRASQFFRHSRKS